jgi:hypothetical protein
MATLGFAIVGVIVINGVFSFWQAYRAGRALAALEKLLPNATIVVRAGAVRQVPAAQTCAGRPDPARSRRHPSRRLPTGGGVRRTREQRDRHRCRWWLAAPLAEGLRSHEEHQHRGDDDCTRQRDEAQGRVIGGVRDPADPPAAAVPVRIVLGIVQNIGWADIKPTPLRTSPAKET